MIGGLFCFGFAFLMQGILVAAIIQYFSALSEKRTDGTISEEEKWFQGCLTVPLQPALQAVLSKDPKGIRIILSICVVVSALTAIVFTSGDGAVIVIALIALTAIGVSALSE